MFTKFKFSQIIFICLFAQTYTYATEVNAETLRLKFLKATRTDIVPVIDGKIDDEVWTNAQPLDDFIQYEPFNLVPASVKTEVRVLYDNNNIYIAFENYDPNPNGIMTRMSRRDDYEQIDKNTDWVGFGFDSNDDDLTGNWFMLTAAGVQLDVSINEARGFRSAYDISWNAVWDGKTSIHSEGWSAEIRIPFNIFQFSKDSDQIWGATFQRGYFAKQEQIHWPGRSKGVRGTIPYYGQILGIKDIPQPKNIELVPYLLAGQTQSGSLTSKTNLGLDLRYNINSSTTLNMAFNPDFGQVEADPSVLNLSAFETRLNEKRPFFVQGANFFSSWMRVFNSRRIGQRPGFIKPDSGDIVDQPNETTILSAAKVLGETSTGVKYGIINAITNQEYASLEFEKDGKTVKKDFLIEPYSNYFVGRVTKPFINDLSEIGFMATDLKRNGYSDIATSLKGDFLINLLDNKFSLTGEYGSTINDRKTGFGGRYRISYRHPVLWELATWGGFYDNKWDVGAMGFQQKNNNWYSGARLSLRTDQPRGAFLNQELNFRQWVSGRHNGLITRNNFEIESENRFTNYWRFGFQIQLNPETYVDDDIYRDSRAVLIKDEAWQEYNVWVSTDSRKKYVIRPWYKINKGDGIDNIYRDDQIEYGIDLTLKPTNNINFSINSSFENRTGFMQWVDIVENSNGKFEDSDGRYDIIYAKTKREQINTRLRMNIAFNPKMTFEAFYQPFNVDMDYKDYYRLNEEKTFKTSSFNYSGNENFKIDNQRGTFVYRWEFRPGSLLYLVYNLNDNNYFSDQDNEWSQSKSNSLFVKFDYFFQP